MKKYMTVVDIENELREILAHIEYLEGILRSEDILKGIIKEEFIELVEQFDSPRLTDIEDNYDDINIEDLIPNEPMVVTISHRGYIKRVPLSTYRAQRRGGKGRSAMTIKDECIFNDICFVTS